MSTPEESVNPLDYLFLQHSDVHCLTGIGADPNKPDNTGWTPLLYAVKRNNWNSTRALLNAKCDINVSLSWQIVLKNSMLYILIFRLNSMMKQSFEKTISSCCWKKGCLLNRCLLLLVCLSFLLVLHHLRQQPSYFVFLKLNLNYLTKWSNPL